MRGWIYIITNKAMPGLANIGCSDRDPALVSKDLNHTGSPSPYIVSYGILVKEPRDFEQKIYSLLDNRKEDKKWFRCSVDEAVTAIRSVVGSKTLVETLNRTEDVLKVKGWLYVMTNKSMPGLVKVGFSTKDPERRTAELKHPGIPHPYVVVYDVLVENPREVEGIVHSKLKNCRENKEWFRCSVEEAVDVIREVIREKALLETFKHVDRNKLEALRRKREEEERAKRAAEEEMRRQAEELRKLRKQEEELQKQEAALNKKQQEIILGYDRLLKDSLSPECLEDIYGMFSFLIWCVGMIVLNLIGKEIRQEHKLLTILAFIGVTYLSCSIYKKLEEHKKEKIRNSDKYKSIIAERDAKLADIEKERKALEAQKANLKNSIIYPEFIFITCKNCKVKNRIPSNKINLGPKCGKCGVPLIDTSAK